MRLALVGFTAVVVSGLIFLTSTKESHADELDKLKGQTIRGVIGEAAGETTDVQSRLFFKYLQVALPDTTILLQNKQGGGGGKALKELAEASGDVLTIATLSRNPIYAHIMKPDDAPYDISKMIWIGSLAKVNRIFAVRGSLGGATVEYLQNLERQPVVGATSSLGAAAIEPLMLNAMTKLRFKVISGMSDPDRQVMLLAGDLDGRMGTLYELQPQFDSGDMVPVLKFTKDGYPKSLDGIPAIAEVVKSDDSKDIVFALETLDRIGGLMIAAAPNSDPEKLQGLRLAFEKVTLDPNFRAEAAKIYFDINPNNGAELMEALNRIIGPTSNIGQQMRSAFDCGTRKSDTGALTCD